MSETDPQRTDQAAPAAHVEPERKEPDWRSLDGMLEELPPGIPILPPEDAYDFSKYTNQPRTFAKSEAWQRCADAMETNISQLCKGYREEIDTLLVFAGLFSAVVTGFTIDSYKWLQDSNDAVLVLLAHITHSLGSDNTAPSAINQTPGLPRSVSTRINVYWFISLALSLSTALVAILAKQWVREFEIPGAFPPEMLVGTQQLKLEGHDFWKVASIISALPLLLQLSLALFAIGILELLWHLHPSVAIAVSIPTLLAALFYMGTTVLPMLQYCRRFVDNPQWPQCAYKSPQALLALQAYQMAARSGNHIWKQIQRLGRPVRQEPGSIDDELHDEILWDRVRVWSRWDLGFWQFDRYVGHLTEAMLHFRAFRRLLFSDFALGTQQSVWNCIWEEANSREQQEFTDVFPRSLDDQQERLRHCILGVVDAWSPELARGPLRTCALMALPLAGPLDGGFPAECVIQNLANLDIVAADQFFSLAKFSFSQDPTFVTSLTRAMVSYCRQHIQEDLGSLIGHTTKIVSRCWDSQARLTQQFIMVDLTLNWIRSGGRPPMAWMFNPLGILLSHLLDDICRDPRDFVRHPEAIRSLYRVQKLAALVRAFCESGGQKVTCPLPDSLDETIRICTRSPYNRADEEKSNDDRIPLIEELLRISVCGANGGSAVLSSSELGDERVAAHVPQEGVASPSDAAQSTSTASHDRVSTLTDTRERRAADADGATVVRAREHAVAAAAPPGPPGLAAAHGEHTMREPRETATPILDIVIVRRGNDRPEPDRGAATPDIGPSAQPREPEGQAAAVAGDAQHASDAVEPRAGQVETEGDAPLPSSSGALAHDEHTTHDRRDVSISDGADIPRLEVVVVRHEDDGADRGPGPGEPALPGSGLQSPHSRSRVVGGSDAAGGDEERRALGRRGTLAGQGRNDAALVDSERVRGATRDHRPGQEINSAASGACAEGDPTRAHRTGASPGTGIGQSAGQV